MAFSVLHHGWANYDQTKTLDYTGLVEEITYENPHGMLQLQHEDKTWTVVLALASDPVFHIKLILLLIGGLNAGFFHRFLAPSSTDWEQSGVPMAARAVTVCSIVVWTAVIACGRLLAH
ncbi:DUF6152 family protein [Pontibacter indicus]|uniref:Uncharacterized protein n=1 Tax=Pontibacter indicus TaxID=1317125 RepID=A0A1R3WZA0_9BACT|nr:DUF6152 family protein [Pontibacter indicus]SIT83656.1 hypothetical protein SAMN05444128_1294 [Pontibacter indicus]